MLTTIAKEAIVSNKNILIIGAPRSGTHALGTMLAHDNNFIYNGEICKMSNSYNLIADIELLKNHGTGTSVSQIVQYIPKIKISNQVDDIKKHAVVINLRRKNKVKQFASWIYFSRYHDIEKGWHSQIINEDCAAESYFTITEEDIELFLGEQIVDDFFKPDYTMFYEDLTFTTATTKQNIFKFDISKIFANLDFVKEKLENWKYPSE